MKKLPKNLKYAFLEAKKSKPVIISADLIVHKEQKNCWRFLGSIRKQ